MSLAVDITHRQGGFTLDASFAGTGRVTALFGRSGAGKTTVVNAIAAQLVAAAEMNWSGPCGKSLSKYGWIAGARVRTYHDPSSSCELSRN